LVQVRRGIRRVAVALRAPQRFGQALDRFVQSVVPVAVPGEERAQALPDSRRLVDGELLLQRDMQAHVQEGIRFADVVPVAVAHRQLQHRVVLGVQQDHVEGERRHAGERFAVTIFTPGAEKARAPDRASDQTSLVFGLNSHRSRIRQFGQRGLRARQR